jgi:hypothetical protein
VTVVQNQEGMNQDGKSKRRNQEEIKKKSRIT